MGIFYAKLRNKRYRRSARDAGSREPDPYPDPYPQINIIPSIRSPASAAVLFPIVRALYDFEPRQPDDLRFRKDDRMKILVKTNEEFDWWYAKHQTTQAEGYIPSNYVVADDDMPESQDWWFSMDRREAERNLMMASNQNGTFLVRCAQDKSSYALSVRAFRPGTTDCTIKHYRIRKMDDQQRVYIAPSRVFSSVTDLILHYQCDEDGLCCQLTKPCPREPEQIPFKDLEVKRSEIQLLQRLGAGQFGEVYAGKWQKNIDVAVKTLKPGSMSREAFLEEAKIMHRLRHRKLVQLMGVCTASEPMYIIVELMANGALLDYLREGDGRSMTFNIMLDVAFQVADAMAYLESKSYIHRDLRAANILVGENVVVKVADFGLARLTEKDVDADQVYEASEGTRFPIKWTAPEALTKRKFSVKSDVWSYGILLYEIVTFGRTPYPDMSNQMTYTEVVAGYRMPKPGGEIVCPDSLYDIMLNCWNERPENRPTFEYLRSLFEDYFVATAASYD